jgi:hypothetical protein
MRLEERRTTHNKHLSTLASRKGGLLKLVDERNSAVFIGSITILRKGVVVKSSNFCSGI